MYLKIRIFEKNSLAVQEIILFAMGLLPMLGEPSRDVTELVFASSVITSVEYLEMIEFLRRNTQAYRQSVTGLLSYSQYPYNNSEINVQGHSILTFAIFQ